VEVTEIVTDQFCVQHVPWTQTRTGVCVVFTIRVRRLSTEIKLRCWPDHRQRPINLGIT